MPSCSIECLDAFGNVTCLRVFLRFSHTGGRDVKRCMTKMAEAFQPRLGDCHVLFTLKANAAWIFGIRYLSEAYR